MNRANVDATTKSVEESTWNDRLKPIRQAGQIAFMNMLAPFDASLPANPRGVGQDGARFEKIAKRDGVDAKNRALQAGRARPSSTGRMSLRNTTTLRSYFAPVRAT